MEDNIGKHPSKDREFFLFVSADETVIFHAKGIFNKIIEGDLLLTDKKLFFYFWSNISRDKVFIATYPYIVSVQLKEGFLNSTLIIENKNKSFEISKINKKDAREFFAILDKKLGFSRGE